MCFPLFTTIHSQLIFYVFNYIVTWMSMSMQLWISSPPASMSIGRTKGRMLVSAGWENMSFPLSFPLLTNLSTFFYVFNHIVMQPSMSCIYLRVQPRLQEGEQVFLHYQEFVLTTNEFNESNMDGILIKPNCSPFATFGWEGFILQWGNSVG